MVGADGRKRRWWGLGLLAVALLLAPCSAIGRTATPLAQRCFPIRAMVTGRSLAVSADDGF